MTFNPIVFSINDTYAPYLYICIKSLLAHIKPSDQYRAYVLYTNLSNKHKENILKLQTDNFKIQFTTVETMIGAYEDDFSVNSHFTVETYYRFFLPQLFSEFDKMLYLDADVLILSDIAPVFSFDLGDNYLGVTHDCEIVRMSNLSNKKYADYFSKTLGVDIGHYFQAGVMLVNLKKCVKTI
jgi:lipopolysaccharide biosynthesis glycosyltransferase